MSRLSRWLCLLTLLALGLAALGGIAWMGLRVDTAEPGLVPAVAADVADPVARGAYLATAANCLGCHTERGGAPYAGGRAIPTPFGVFHSPNLTPDTRTGIGSWSAEDFWHALHDGKRPDGSPLYPSFPYTHYTRLSRPDVDAIRAYLLSLDPVQRANRPHELRFPYDQRWLLVAWRALFFRPGGYQMDAAQDATWNRGAYLVQGVAHCGACHEARNSLGAIVSRRNPAGGVVLNWYAPALDAGTEAGVSHWSQEDVVRLLRDGRTEQASTLGPMAEVVYDSLQHLHDEDIGAMAHYLRALPDRGPAPDPAVIAAAAAAASDVPRSPAMERGARGYAKHCADCHGENGEGRAPAAPALAGNRALTLSSTVNPIRVVLYGGFAPGTAGNPEPFGMPPFDGTLDDQQIADILSFARHAWGNAAPPVRAFQVQRERSGPLW